MNQSDQICISFDAYTNTIRQMPQNYLIARRPSGAWILDPDSAANKHVVMACALTLLNHDVKFGDGPSFKRIAESNLKELQYEHIGFHYVSFSRIKKGCQFKTVKIFDRVLLVLNTDEIPEDESYQSIVCFQEVLDEDNHRWLVYFDVFVGFVGE